MGLVEYNKKRNFSKTAEPAGKLGRRAKKGKALHFVIQKHDASHLHYDFRLELDGVLKSWAVPKGPSLDPSNKRLAMQVEDHPVGYADFEGTIPEGEYGGGTVMVWDRGTWTPNDDSDPEAALAKGGLKFSLEGEKLHGAWALFRIKRDERGKAAWLLVKEKDKFALHGRQKDVIDAKPNSVVSGRDLSGIATDKKGRVWNSKPGKKAVAKKTARSVRVSGNKDIVDVPEAPKKSKTESSERVGGVSISHPYKILYEGDRIQKIELAKYYEEIAPRMLPYVQGRPLMVVRCPAGEGNQCFFQKNWNSTLPSALKKIKARKDGKIETFFTVDSAEGLIALAQIGVLEIHCWNSHAGHIEHPDQWVFDLDPSPELAWKHVVSAAHKVRDRLKSLGLKSFLKTTGGKGLHVVAPVEPKLDWKLGKAFAEAVCKDLEVSDPTKFLVNMSKEKRTGKIFLDYLRNGRGATAVAPYSTRARTHAPISMPIRWEDLEAGVHSADFTIRDYAEKMQRRDPWLGFLKLKQFPKT